MSKLHFPIRTLIAASLSSVLGVAAQAETLVDIYELALENDAQLKAEVAQYNADIELEKLALAPLLPQAGAGYSYIDTETDSTRPNVTIDPNTGAFDQIDVTSVTETETDGYDVSLSQTLFDLSAWFSWRAGKETSQQAKANLSAAQQSLIVRVVQAYFGVLRTQDNLRASQAQERAFERQLEQTHQGRQEAQQLSPQNQQLTLQNLKAHQAQQHAMQQFQLIHFSICCRCQLNQLGYLCNQISYPWTLRPNRSLAF